MNNRYICKAKRKDNNEWIYGDLIIDQYGKYYIHPNTNAFSVNEYNLAKCIQMIEVIPETVGQCTGLKDKNGKLIFEGDVVKLTDNNAEWKAHVVFGNPYGEYNWGWNLMYIGEKPKVNTDILLWVETEETGAYCEVIGNIHDDKYLLEVER